MGEFQRDQHSRQYDGYARKALLGAIRSRAAGGRGVRVFVVSPAAQFGNRDRGGLTVNERAFSRAAYYPVQQVPRQLARAKGLGRDGRGPRVPVPGRPPPRGPPRGPGVHGPPGAEVYGRGGIRGMITV